MNGTVIIFLPPVLICLVLVAVAFRVRRAIDPACPTCRSQKWQHVQHGITCSSCGWTSAPQRQKQPLEHQAA